jgi:NADPH-ferrihemoprotein reductase
MFIYFGSQTGTAEGYARVVMEEAKQQGFDGQTVDLEDFDPDQLATAPLTVFLMATYGEGEPTDNSAKFAKWMRNSDDELSADLLSGVRFAVFGLGNKQYEHFNRMGKLTDECLAKLGGRRVLEVGLGDDDGALEDDFERWRESLWASLSPPVNGVTSQASISSLAEERPIDLHFKVDYIGANQQSSTAKGSSIHSMSKHLFQTPKVGPKFIYNVTT